MSTDEKLSTSPLLSRQGYSVGHSPGTVVLNFGNARIEMDFETALQISALLRLHGGQVKRKLGYTGMNFFTAGILEDAEEIVRREQANRWA